MSAIGTQVMYSVIDDSMKRQRRTRRWTLVLLFMLGMLLEVLYLALYPWLTGRNVKVDSVRQSWEKLFPWLGTIYRRLDWLPYLMHMSWPAALRGHLYPLLLLSGGGMLFILLASRVGKHAERILFAPEYLRSIFRLILIFTGAFGVTMVCSPIYMSSMARDMFLSGLYGRMVVSYHLNPYIANPVLLTHDNIQRMLMYGPGSNSYPVPVFGPVWVDINILIALIPHGDIVGLVLSLRALSLLVHMLNVVLLWLLLAAMNPLRRISATLLYAWNPLVLLFGVSLVHQELVSIFFLLLALLSLQRGSTILSWVFVLLMSLVNLSCLILLPLLFMLQVKQTRFLGLFWRICWWPAIGVVTALVVFLAYVPYWQSWGVKGIISSIRQVFWQGHAINSLDAAILVLPVHPPAALLWLFSSVHWSLVVLAVMGGYLLFALWLADTFELVLQCCCWLLLIGVVLQPVYWPWYLLVPLVIGLCANHQKIMLCIMLLICGALVNYYFWQWSNIWLGQGLIVIGVPCLLWGWIIFFTSTWQMSRDRLQSGEEDEDSGPMRFIRPPWLTRPSMTTRVVKPGSRRSI